MHMLENVEDMHRIVKLAAAFALPADAAAEFTNKVETGEVRIPSRKTIHRAAIKLDYMTMLYERLLFKESLATNTTWLSQFGGDSSPQVTFDFMRLPPLATTWKPDQIRMNIKYMICNIIEA